MSSRFAAAAALLATAFAAAPAAAATSAPGIVEVSRPQSAAVARGRTAVAVDPERFLGAGKGALRALPTTDGRPLIAAADRVVAHADGRRTWIGRVETPLGPQSAVLTFDDAGRAFGWLPQRDGLPLRVETDRDGTWLRPAKATGAGLDDDARRLPGADDAVPAPKATALQVPTVHVAALGDVPVVDVLVGYTPELAALWGGEEVMRTRIAFLEALSNQVYVDSDAAVQIRVVSMLRVDGELPYTNGEVLDRITDASTDPVKSALDAARAAVGADLVVMMLDGAPGRGSCGVAWLQGRPSWSGMHMFGVVNDRAAYPEYDCWEITFTHEVGHLLGSHHDTVTSGGDWGAWVYSRGYRGQVPGYARGFATVMAYPTAVQDYVARLSNPRQPECQGWACGIVDQADNARSHTDAAATVAAMLPQVVPLPGGGLAIGDGRVVENHQGTTAMRFRVTRTGDLASAASFALRALPGTAMPGDDYIAPTGRVTMAAGIDSVTVQVAIVGDREPEREESFRVVLTQVEGAVATRAVGTAVIDDDDPGVWVEDVAFDEGQGERTVAVRVGVTRGAPGPVQVRVRSDDRIEEWPDQLALDGEDFRTVDRVVTIPAGADHVEVPVTLLGDRLVEPAEAFELVLSDVVNAGVFDARGRVTLRNDDAGFAFAEPRVHVIEGSGGGVTQVGVSVIRYGAAAETTVGVVLESGTGTAGVDATAVQAQYTQAAGDTYGTVVIDVAADDIDEAHETLTLRLTSDRWEVPSQPVVIAIGDDDGGPPMLSVGDAEADEGTYADAGLIAFPVRLSEASPASVHFRATLVDETTSGDDLDRSYLSGYLPAGWTETVVHVRVNGDRVVEADETFRLELHDVEGVAVADGVATGTVRNDDADWPVAWLQTTGGFEGSPGRPGRARVVLTLDKPALAGTTGTITITGGAPEDGLATPGVDLPASVPFPAVAAGARKIVFDVPFSGDDDPEYDEHYAVALSGLKNVYIDNPVLHATIANDDFPRRAIGEIQGAGPRSPLEPGTASTIEAVVVAVDAMGRLVVQDAGDGDPATSDALRVYPNDPTVFARGDRLRLGGTTREEFLDHAGLRTGTVMDAQVIDRLARGVALPVPATLDATVLDALATADTLSRFEWMRVAVPGARVVGPGGRGGLGGGEYVDPRHPEADDGRFAIVVDRLPPPWREPGLSPDVHVPLPAGVQPVRWDGNREVLAVDALAFPGTLPRPVDAGDRFERLVGVLVLGGPHGIELQMTPGQPDAVPGAAPTAAAPRGPAETMVAWLDADYLFDDDDTTGGPGGLPADVYATRLAKLARMVCGTLRAPALVAVDGVEGPEALADLAAAVNAIAADDAACDDAPAYLAVMPTVPVDRNEPQLGWLVRTDATAGGPRVDVTRVEHVAAAERFEFQWQNVPLFARPPVVLIARVRDDRGIARSLRLLAVSLHDAAEGAAAWPIGGGQWMDQGEPARVRRARQAVAIGEWIHARQTAAPGESLVVLGDFDAPDGGDGLVDALGIVAGRASPATQVVTHAASPVARPLVDVGARLPAAQRWDSLVRGHASALAHVLVSAPLDAPGTALRVEMPRVAAGFAGDHVGDAGSPVRATRRDPLLLRIIDTAGTGADLAASFVGARLGGGDTAVAARIDNLGPGVAEAPTMVLIVGLPGAKLPLPEGWRCASRAVSAGTRFECTRPAPLAAGETVRWNLGLASKGTIALTLRVSSATPDPRRGNDAASHVQ